MIVAEPTGVRGFADLAGTRSSPAPAPTGPDALSLLNAFRRCWLHASGLGLLAAIAIGSLTWFLVPPQYTAFALIRMASIDPRIVAGTTGARVDFATYQRTQAMVIKTRPVLMAALAQPQVAAFGLDEVFADPVIWLEQAIKTDYSSNSEILRVSLSGDDPRQLPVLVNAVADAYLKETVDVERIQRAERIQHLEKAHGESEDLLRSKRDELRNLADLLGTSDSHALTTRQQMALEYFAELRKEQVALQSQVRKVQLQLAALEATSQPDSELQVSDSDVMAAIDADPVMREFVARVAQLKELALRYQRAGVSDTEPTSVLYRKELEAAEQTLNQRRHELRPAVVDKLLTQLRSQANSQYEETAGKLELLVEQERLVSAEVDRLSEQADKIGTNSSQLELLRAELAQVDSVAKSIRSELAALRVEPEAPPRVKLVQPAVVPRVKETRRRNQLATLSTLGGFAMVVLLLSYREFLTGRIETKEQLAKSLGLRVLGTVPHVPAVRVGRVRVRDGHAAARRSAAYSASVDAIRTKFVHDSMARSIRSVMITSAVPGEGKTTLAVQLATSLAGAGYKTVLVDGDLRHPTAHLQLDQPRGPGFCDALTNLGEISQLAHATSVEGLWFMPSGSGSAAPSRRLSHDAIRDVLIRLKQDYEYVVLDSSPLLAVADALLIGQCVDAAILSVLSGVSRIEQIRVASEQLAEVEIPLLGVVVSGNRNVPAYEGSAVPEITTAAAHV